MRKELKKPALLLILMIALATAAVAQPQHGMGGRENRPGDMMEKLNLTVEQEKQMQDLRFDLEKARIDLRAELQTERLALKQLRKVDAPNKKKIYAQIDKVGAVEIKIEKARVDHRLAARNILTDDQFKVFQQGMHQGQGRFGDQQDNCRKDRGNRPSPHRF